MKNYKLPSLVMRNARKRGERESEKVLSMEHEFCYDVHVQFQDIIDQTSRIQTDISNKFQGESIENTQNLLVSYRKSIAVNKNQLTYPLIQEMAVSSIDHVVLKLKGGDTISPTDYTIFNNNSVTFRKPVEGIIIASFIAKVSFYNQRYNGQDDLIRRLSNLNARMEQLDERIKDYANANF